MEVARPNRLFDAFRWIGVLPVAVAGAWITWVLINVLGRFSLGWVGVTAQDFLGKLYFITMGHAAMGAAFVYVGAKVAPGHRVIVAFIMGGVAIVIAGFLLFPAVLVHDWWAFLGGVCVAIGAGAGAGAVVWSVHAGETDLA